MKHGNVFAYISLWSLISSIITACSAEGPQLSASHGYSPGPPPLVLLIGLHLIAGALAAFCQRMLDAASLAMSAIFWCCSCKCAVGVPVVIDVVLWVTLLGVHPAACLIALNTRGVFALGSFRRHAANMQVANGSGTHRSGLLETRSWLAGLIGVQFICTLFYTPSAILTGWMLNGQHKEASLAAWHDALQADLKISRHSILPFVDSYFFERRSELRRFIELPALGLVLPAVSLALHAANLKRMALVGGGGAQIRPTRVATLCSYILLVISAIVVPLVGHRPYRVWFACQPAFAVHALIPIALYVEQLRARDTTKVE